MQAPTTVMRVNSGTTASAATGRVEERFGERQRVEVAAAHAGRDRLHHQPTRTETGLGDVLEVETAVLHHGARIATSRGPPRRHRHRRHARRRPARRQAHPTLSRRRDREQARPSAVLPASPGAHGGTDADRILRRVQVPVADADPSAGP